MLNKKGLATQTDLFEKELFLELIFFILIERGKLECIFSDTLLYTHVFFPQSFLQVDTIICV